jgi:amidohydrolase
LNSSLPDHAAVLAAIQAEQDDIIAIRRDIHAHPETGFEETRTAALVAEKLKSWGIPVEEGIAKTGVVGTIKGKRPGNRVIGLRADMDALFISEQTGLPHASTDPKRMHACGHDGHTAMLLAAARHLAKNPDFAGTVHVIFQPAEEGLGGAREMIKEGFLDRFPMDAVYGMHNAPEAPVGTFTTRTGPMMAAADTWTITFHGTGGHGGAAAHLSTDPTQPAAAFVLAVQGIIGRNVAAIDTAVLSLGHIQAGDYNSPNIIPSKVVLRGTARSYRPEVRDILERRLGEVAQGLAATHNCTVDVHYLRRYPPLVNAAAQTALAAEVAGSLVGNANVDTDLPPRTGAEDFSFMLEKVPGSMIFIGNGSPERGLHTPVYDFNDDILALGATYWVMLTKRELA